MSDRSSAISELKMSTDTTDNKPLQSSFAHPSQQSSEKIGLGLQEGYESNSLLNSEFVKPADTTLNRMKAAVEKMSQGFGAFGKFMFSAFSVLMYVIGLFGFLCGASVPLITLWFFMKVDTQFHWWHFILGIGGNIGIFVMSMTMIRDLYVQPLIEK
ncbi:MAG TPA: hypothetical protein ENH10_01690, partial [Bacteroidetes bacterium]|nr:hypothetical protein [Bacteroidota bacterium]HEX03857.1 hypothetical protein [Bacteroidota bacterium]